MQMWLKFSYASYNGVSSNPITPLEGIKNRAPASIKILYEQGSNTADEFPVLSAVPEDAFSSGSENVQGVKAEYFNNMNLSGTPFLTRVDKQIDFDFTKTPPTPERNNKFSVRWTGWITPPVTDTYFIGFAGDDGYRVYLDNKLILEDWRDHATYIE